MILKLHGHIGSTASALVDGQLSPAEEERAWKHVLGCAGCRRLVEQEGWVKQRVHGLSAPGACAAPPALVGALYDVDAWATVDDIERRSTRRRTTTALVGAGSVGLAVMAMVAVSAPPAGLGEVPGNRAPAMIDNGSPQPVRDSAGTGATADVENAAFGGRTR